MGELVGEAVEAHTDDGAVRVVIHLAFAALDRVRDLADHGERGLECVEL